MKYLIDTSALIRMSRHQVDEVWYGYADRGLIAICDPVLLETLTGFDARTFGPAEEAFRALYPWVPVPDDSWRLVQSIQRDLAARSQHQGLSVADHLVIATAIKLKLTVLHEDADFETVARQVPQLQQQRVSAAPDPS